MAMDESLIIGGLKLKLLNLRQKNPSNATEMINITYKPVTRFKFSK